MPARAPGRRSPHTGDAPLIPVIRRTAGPKRTPLMKRQQEYMKRYGDGLRADFRISARARHLRTRKRLGYGPRAWDRSTWPIFGTHHFPFPWPRYGSR